MNNMIFQFTLTSASTIHRDQTLFHPSFLIQQANICAKELMEVWKEGLSHLKQAESTPLQLLGQINPPKAPKKKRGGQKGT
jgi:hypothetical protein